MNIEEIMQQRDEVGANFYCKDNDQFNTFLQVCNFKNEFSFLNLNVASIANLNKFQDLTDYVGLLEIDPDLMVFTET